MDPLTIATIAAPILGGLFGSGQASADRKQQMQLIAQSVKDLEAVGIPSVEAQKLILEEYKSAGNYDPEMESYIMQGSSNLGDVETNPMYREASENALSELSGIGEAGGMRLSDKAMIGDVLGEVDTRNRGRQEAIKSDVMSRGGGGGGFELAARLQAGQGAASEANSRGLGVAAMAEDRALQAILQGGDMGMKMESQDYNQKAREAEANDAIANWNAMNQTNTQQRNVGSGNEAQLYNLGNDQRLMDANVDTRNKEQGFNKGLLQTKYGNEMDHANSMANARSEQASQLGASADKTAGMWSGIGQGVGDLAGYLDRTKSNSPPAGNWGATDDQYLKRKTPTWT